MWNTGANDMVIEYLVFLVTFGQEGKHESCASEIVDVGRSVSSLLELPSHVQHTERRRMGRQH